MQQEDKKIFEFNKTVGEIIKELRIEKGYSVNKFSNSYDFDRGNFSKFERGFINCRLSNAYKMAQALNIKFSDFAKILEEKLGENFSLLDE